MIIMMSQPKLLHLCEVSPFKMTMVRRRLTQKWRSFTRKSRNRLLRKVVVRNRQISLPASVSSILSFILYLGHERNFKECICILVDPHMCLPYSYDAKIIRYVCLLLVFSYTIIHFIFLFMW